MVRTNRGKKSFSNSLSFGEGHKYKNTWYPCPEWTLELDKTYGSRFSSVFISPFVNTGARTLSSTVMFTLQPSDRWGGQVWLNHFLFNRMPSNTIMSEVVYTSQQKKKTRQHAWLVKRKHHCPSSRVFQDSAGFLHDHSLCYLSGTVMVSCTLGFSESSLSLIPLWQQMLLEAAGIQSASFAITLRAKQSACNTILRLWS